MGEADFIVKTTHFASANAGDVLAAPNPERVAIIFSGPVGLASVTVSPVGSVGDTVNLVVPSSDIMRLTFRDFGPLPALGWKAGSGTAGAQVDVVEILRAMRE